MIERRRRVDEAAKASVNAELVCNVSPYLAVIPLRETLPLESVIVDKRLCRKFQQCNLSGLLLLARNFSVAAPRV